MLKVEIDRTEWDISRNRKALGAVGADLELGSLLRFIDGHRLQCCLGHIGSACGIRDAVMYGTSMPSHSGLYDLWPESLTTVIHEDTSLEDWLSAENDNNPREAEIIRLAAKGGIEITFTGQYLDEATN